MYTFLKYLLPIGLLISTFSLTGQHSYLKIFDTDDDAEFQDLVCLENGQIIIALTCINLEAVDVQSGLLFQKISQKGDLLWTRRPSEFENEEIEIETLIQTSKGEILAVGLSGNDYVGTEPFIAKLDTSAHVIWKKTLNYPIPIYLTSVIENKKGEFIVTGTYSLSNGNPAITLLRFDSEGEIMANYEYFDEEKKRIAYDIVETSNAYYLAGNCPKGEVGASFSVLKLRKDFTLDWVKNYHKTEDVYLTSEASTLDVDRDGNLVVGGRESWSDRKTAGGKIIKIDTAGNLLWEKNVGNNEHAAIIDLVISSKNKYLLLTEVRSETYKKSICLFTLNKHGKALKEQLWERSESDRPKCIQAMKSGGYILGGMGDLEAEKQSFLLAKLNKVGKLKWKKIKKEIPIVRF